MYRPEPRSIIGVRCFWKIKQHNKKFDFHDVCKKRLHKRSWHVSIYGYEVTADRTPEVWILIPRVGHEPLAFSCMSISTHSTSWQSEVWPKVMIIIITRLIVVDPLKLVIDTGLTQSIYAFFFFFLQICELKRIDLLPRWTKSNDPYVYNGSWNWHRNGWIENKYLSEYQLSIFIAGNLKLLLLQLFLSTV